MNSTYNNPTTGLDGLGLRIEPQCALTVKEAWELSTFLQSRMTDEESIEAIGLIATKLYHFCRENPDL